MKCKDLKCHLKYLVCLWLMFFIFMEGITTCAFYIMSGIWSWPFFIISLLISIFISILYVLVNYDNSLGYADLW